MSAELVLEVKNERREFSHELERIAAVAEELGEREDWSPALAFKVNLALEEFVLNTITHGYHQGLHEIEVTLTSNEDAVTIKILDNGLPFDPLNDAPSPDVGAEIEDRRVGGLGVHLVLEMMSQVEYERIDDKNCLTMKALRDE